MDKIVYNYVEPTVYSSYWDNINYRNSLYFVFTCGVYLISSGLGGKYGYIHFINEDSETQKGEVTYLRLHDKWNG